MWISLEFMHVNFIRIHACEFHWNSCMWISLEFMHVNFVGIHACELHCNSHVVICAFKPVLSALWCLKSTCFVTMQITPISHFGISLWEKQAHSCMWKPYDLSPIVKNITFATLQITNISHIEISVCENQRHSCLLIHWDLPLHDWSMCEK
jgi:hypothetical protein